MGIGLRLKEARETLGITQKELGTLVGVTASAITNYENETSHPKEPVMYALLNALKVDANFLFQDCVNTSNQNVKTAAFSIDKHEERVITAYRENPNMQSAVDKLLGLDEAHNTVPLAEKTVFQQAGAIMDALNNQVHTKK